MSFITFVIEFEDGKEPAVHAHMEAFGGKVTSVAFHDALDEGGNDGTTGKPLTITLFDISSKAFWSGTGKSEIFHPETYRRWVKEAIERYCAISGIEVKVK